MQQSIKSGKCQSLEVLLKLKESIKVGAVTLSWVEVFRECFTESSVSWVLKDGYEFTRKRKGRRGRGTVKEGQAESLESE